MNTTSIRAIILAIFIGISVFLFFWNPSAGGADLDRTQFAIEDTASVERIRIIFDQQLVDLQRMETDNWILNDSLPAEPSLIKLVLAVLNRNRIQYPIGTSEAGEIKSRLDTAGSKITVTTTAGETTMLVGGDGTSASWFMDAEERIPYQVTLPGYQEYLAGIFSLPAPDWKSRLVSTGSFRTMQSVRVSYPDKDPGAVNVAYRDGGMRVNELQNIDSMRLFQFLQDISRFYVDQYASKKRLEALDSLQELAPVATIDYQDLDPNQSFTLEVYPSMAQDRFVLARLNKTEWVLLLQARVKRLLVTLEDFMPEKEDTVPL